MPENAPNKVEITKRYHTITLADSDQVVTLTERSVNVVSAGVQGPRGARGETGAAGDAGGYTHTQDQPASSGRSGTIWGASQASQSLSMTSK